MAHESPPRLTPDQLLNQIELEERKTRRGRLKVFLGYGGGVGKSFQMLDEARRRRERGEDVVVCALQSTYPPEIRAILEKLEVIPTLKNGDREAIDVPAVIRRHPHVAVVDGLAYDNPPGLPNAHRWQDVEQLMDAQISVLATLNLEYLEKHREEMEHLTGKSITTVIPAGFLDRMADEIVVVDAPTVSVADGDLQPGARAAAVAKRQKFSRMRELALLVAASVVDHQLESYLRAHGVDQPWGVQERILVCISPRSDVTHMLQSGRRNAERFQGELYAVCVREEPPFTDAPILEQNLRTARALGAQVEMLNGDDGPQAILDFAAHKGVTQIFIGHEKRQGIRGLLGSSFVERVIRLAEGIDVLVYPS